MLSRQVTALARHQKARLRHQPDSDARVHKITHAKRSFISMPEWISLHEIFNSFVGSSLTIIPALAVYYAVATPSKELSKEQYLKKIKAILQKKYTKQHRRALEKLPVFKRSDHEEMVKILTTPTYIGKIVLVEGYSGSGKTTVIDGLLDGRAGVVSIPLKEKAIGQRDAGVRIVSDVLDCRIGDKVNFNTLLGYWEESVDSMIKSNPDVPPLVWIDDIERGIDPKSGRFYPEFESFLSWLGSISDRMIVVLSGPLGHHHQLKAVSGFSTRLKVHSFPTLDSAASEIESALENNYHLTAEECKTVIAKLGTSLEDIGDLITATINSMPFQNALDAVIEKGSRDVFDALIAKYRPTDIGKQDWTFTVYVIFRELSKSETLSIDALLQQLPSSVTIDIVIRVVSHHILTYIGKSDISFRATRFRAAFAKQLETEWIKIYFKNTRVTGSHGRKASPQ